MLPSCAHERSPIARRAPDKPRFRVILGRGGAGFAPSPSGEAGAPQRNERMHEFGHSLYSRFAEEVAKQLSKEDMQCALFMSPVNYQSRRATVTHLTKCFLEVLKCLVVIEGKTAEGSPWQVPWRDL